ncbi:hypothetical protein TcWFU_004441 [Taenia crassiceps]|uniref:Uncharacterized protein n=1 Tax=Taenia crassiceps TaxID=6207 RepID=A0ABR4QSA2_9CEST
MLDADCFARRPRPLHSLLSGRPRCGQGLSRCAGLRSAYVFSTGASGVIRSRGDSPHFCTKWQDESVSVTMCREVCTRGSWLIAPPFVAVCAYYLSSWHLGHASTEGCQLLVLQGVRCWRMNR